MNFRRQLRCFLESPKSSLRKCRIFYCSVWNSNEKIERSFFFNEKNFTIEIIDDLQTNYLFICFSFILIGVKSKLVFQN